MHLESKKYHYENKYFNLSNLSYRYDCLSLQRTRTKPSRKLPRW